MADMDVRTSGTYRIDLNTVRDDNRVATVVGACGPERVPNAGEAVTVVDEDGSSYDAVVETVLPDSRVFFRVVWATQREPSIQIPVLTFGPFQTRPSVAPRVR